MCSHNLLRCFFLDGSVLLCVLSAIADFLIGDTKTMSEERQIRSNTKNMYSFGALYIYIHTTVWGEGEGPFHQKFVPCRLNGSTKGFETSEEISPPQTSRTMVHPAQV